ncbi:hypothetical protein Bca101_073561 [Brassica carinata]
MAVYNRMPWMCAQRDNNNVQEKTTQNLLELIRPVRFYATVDSVLRVSGEINLPKEGSKVSMKPKGKIFGRYLDLFPNLDHRHKGGVRLESLESSKDTQEGKNESSAETDTLEMDKLQMMCLSDDNSRCEREVNILGSFSGHDNFPHFLDAYGIMIMSIQ